MLDESSHPDSKLEWWFIHGRYRGERVEERYFMASVFRLRVPDAADAFSALISVLDPVTGRQWTSSRVDRRVLDAVNDPRCPEVVLDELRRFGLPREFECPCEVPMLSGAPLRFQWADLTLDSSPCGIVLEFNEPGTCLPLHLRLDAAAQRLTIDAARAVGDPDEAMNYVTYPHMGLDGSAGGLAVDGEAWFDHQWGGHAWMQSADSPPRLRGWDWLGFRLDDGSVWVLMSHWDCRSREEFSRHLTMRDSSGAAHACRSFECAPVRWWTSPATRVRYPVEWKLRVPEWEADLMFAPVADNQEIRVFGPQRAIWEGAGCVTGSFRGRRVDGAGRLEVQGLGYIFDIAGYLKGWAEIVDREIERFLPREFEEPDIRRYAGPPAWAYDPAAYTSVLSKPLWDLLGRDGKRWRAVFSLLLVEALGRDTEPIRDVLVVLPELLHNASLIIDDIQDDSATRRGQETIHRRYGVDIAISAANTAYFLPLLLVLDHPVLMRDEKQGICEVYQRQIVRAHLGQSLDLSLTHSLDETRLDAWMADSIGPKILQMYALKTAAPVEGLAQVASILAAAGDGTRQAATQFARAFGMAFQMVDDVNNFSGAAAWGKQRAEDLRKGKLTYLILCALQRLPAADGMRLREILCRPELRLDTEVLNTGIDLVMRSGACEDVRRQARGMVAPAWDLLSQSVPASTAKTELRLLWESLVGLSFEKQEPLES